MDQLNKHIQLDDHKSELKKDTKSDRQEEIKGDNLSLDDIKEEDKLDDLKESSGDSSIDSNIEILNQDEIDENKENVIEVENKIKITVERNDSYSQSMFLDRSLDRSKTSIDDLSFSQKTLIKSCSLRSLITELVNDEIMIDKSELSKDLDESQKEKFFQIIRAIKQEDNDKKVEQLKELCITDQGLILSDLRRIVWPIITNSHHINPNHQPDHETIINHPMYNQVIQDVNRTIKRFPPSIEKEERLSKEKQLTDLIMRILIENPRFYYYQGYHDICITFLLLLGEEKAFHVVNKVSNTHLSQFMEETMNSTQLLLEIIPIVIEREDRELSQFLNRIEVGTIFSLSWILTWFSHILVNNRNVERLFDIFLATDFRLPVYFTISILLHHREIILSKEQDMAIVFQCLIGLLDEEDEFPFELLLRQGLELMDKHRPETLLSEQKRRMSIQQKKEEDLRSEYWMKKNKPICLM